MKNTAKWIPLALIALFALYRLIQYQKEELLIFIIVIALSIALAFGLDRYYRWRSKRLLQSILPSESLVASGLVSESTSDETPAILVQSTGNRYRIYIADSRGSQAVISVAPELTSHTNKYDLKEYLEIHTDQGNVHFAPRNKFGVRGQPEYAQEVLTKMFTDGVRRTG